MTDRFGHLAFCTATQQIQVMVDLQETRSSVTEAVSPERRARIMAGADEIFTRDGYEGASVAQIAVAARVSKGTLYNYFPSKEALFAAVVKANCGRMWREMFVDLPDDAPLGDELSRIGRTMLKMMLSRRGLAMFRVVVMEASKFPDLAHIFMEAGPQLLVKNMADWISRRVQSGEMTVNDPNFAAEQFFALTQTRLVMRARVDAGYAATDAEIDHVVAGAIRVFLAAYRTPPF